MQPVITGIRQKLGGLRITIDGGDAYVDDLVTLAAVFSRVTCEACGASADVIPGPCVRTLCSVHAEDHPQLTRIRPLEASGPVLDLRNPRDVPPFVLPPVAVTDIRIDGLAVDWQGGDGAHGRARAFFDLFLSYAIRVDRDGGQPLRVAP
ncbi:hypothetical protein LLG90_24090 [Aromatoleum toluclasticum]|uniref:hypothetical protein n=1 Tax=Aromatoleum toluclasticum TaxID=92003 RepID=UPI001D18C1B8|nr:hypothetical protein [Aromatoleum toluclasticum]MCC4118442.1 hypothetical protein [Aromatoleum toluclasticum]